MKYYIEFYKSFDKKLDGGLSGALMILGLFASTTVITFIANWKDEMMFFEKFLLSLVASLILFAVIGGIGLVIYGIFTWITKEVIPKFKETQEDFDYIPEPKGKVEFN